ncbi:hypothetical protein FMZ73_07330 [Salmonella enterica subsp. enterica]|nr:hypothetical protein [Salmonella enterica subsp. enterica serovar Nigeria]ECJ1028186.1 hypothetical protein [Salmonella enterica subsp. enterica serovar Nigeria]EDG1633141.1 hypothetical protein [Salmonella enterica subsp. enterica serovar Nigeria]EGM6703095.1 hypothetical protein [Salmonella enterica subsp. enterica serovar Nigeria]
MKRKEHTFEDCVLKPILSKTALSYIPQYKVFTRKHGTKRIDFYLPTIKTAIEFDEDYHGHFDQIRQDKERESLIANMLHCEFIRFPEHEPRLIAARRLENYLRGRGVKFLTDRSERDFLQSKIRNCQDKIEQFPHLLDFYYQRLTGYQSQLADLEMRESM